MLVTGVDQKGLDGSLWAALAVPVAGEPTVRGSRY